MHIRRYIYMCERQLARRHAWTNEHTRANAQSHNMNNTDTAFDDVFRQASDYLCTLFGGQLHTYSALCVYIDSTTAVLRCIACATIIVILQSMVPQSLLHICTQNV
jgi:hypothetical protein